MTLVDKLNELGGSLGIRYEDNFAEGLDKRRSKGAIDSKSWAVHKQVQQDIPAFLYHYTSQQAAFSILQTGTLRATDAYFLNDLMEIKHGAEALKRALEKLRDLDIKRYEKIKQAIGFLTSPFLQGNERAYARHRGNAYVVSFSTIDDDVSQWQKYAIRHGVSLGFGVDLLSKAILTNCDGREDEGNEASTVEALLAPVIYDDVGNLADLAFEDMQALDLGTTNPHEKLVERYACFTSLMKHPSFASENEWRLLFTQAQVDRSRACWQQGEAFARPFANMRFAEKWRDQSMGKPTKNLKRQCKIRVNAQDYNLARHYFDFMGVAVLKSEAPLRPQ